MKLRGGALYYALVFSLIISVLSALFILFTFYLKKEYLYYAEQQDLIENCHSGLAYLKSEDSHYGEYMLDLYQKKKDSVSLKKTYWGLFNLHSVNAFRKGKSIAKTAIMGQFQFNHKKTALYLSKASKTLHLSGQTKIKGNTFLSEYGVKRVAIEGVHYIGNKLVNGKTFSSEKHLPFFNENTQKYISDMLKRNFGDEKNILHQELNDLYSLVEIERKFQDKTIVYSSSQTVVLEQVTLKGNIVVYSSKEIIVKQSALLEDVILVAPKVVVLKASKGQFHIIASKSVALGENVEMFYPSSIALKSNSVVRLTIEKNARFIGDIVLNGKNTIKKVNFADIKEKAIIEGNLYCAGAVSLKGEIKGSLFCHYFYLKTPSAIYKNYLLNAVIDNSSRNVEYSAGFIFKNSYDLKVVKWL